MCTFIGNANFHLALSLVVFFKKPKTRVLGHRQALTFTQNLVITEITPKNTFK